ncbi:MAG: hypothetical protein ACUVQ1_04000 [Candidatus Kapaibacteriales bacterium]
MKLSENIDKVVWIFLDKAWYVLYGFVMLLQIRRLEPEILGSYAILISIHTWIFIIVDSLFLTSIIQFGFDPHKERQANSYSLLFTFLFVFIINIIIYLPSGFWGSMLKDVNFRKISVSLPLLTIVTIPRIYAIKFCFKHSSMFKLFLIDSTFFGSLSVLTIILFFQLEIFTFEFIYGIYLNGTILSSIVGVILLRKNIRLGFRGNLKLKEFFSFGFPMFRISFFQSIPKQLDIIILQYFFQSKLVGIYYSAKTLFRLFEEGMNASSGLVYPTAVRLIAKGKRTELNSLLSKSISFTFLIMLFCFVMFEFGASNPIISFLLPQKYKEAIPIFNLMILSTLFMPFQLFASILIAEGQPNLVANQIFISTIISVMLFVIVGASGYFHLAPFGIIFYYFIFFVLLFVHSRRKYDFHLKVLFKSILDLKGFLLKLIRN